VEFAPWLGASTDGAVRCLEDSLYPFNLGEGVVVQLEIKCRAIFANKPYTSFDIDDSLAFEYVLCVFNAAADIAAPV
jgi:hypothetical protein